MKNKILIFAITFFALEIFAQTKPASPSGRGASPIAVKSEQATTKNTYAVVVGISDYQDKDIPDLRFADKDAEAFAGFLRSEAGGKLDVDHLKVLLNQEATMAQFAIALDWLWENAKEGDQVIIYFSGHGDVEKKSLTQPGYLLCWDAPARVYLAGGALALPMFQDVISTLSVQNKAKVIVITDACRSGKLAGSSVGGSQITGANLAKQTANEIKILSCQPNEYSIEGEQWGGGRGAFSFNLVNALYGMADSNNDLIVNLQEAGRYLEDHVTEEVAPISQLPMVLGNRNEKVATVNTTILAALQSGKSSQMTMLSAIDSKGIEGDVLAGLDTSTRELYQLFKKSLKDKVFLEPATACADFYYRSLMLAPKMKRLNSTITRNYAAALQDDSQQTLNEWLKTKQDISLETTSNSHLPQKVFSDKVRAYPRCLDRAAELLGSKHYMYRVLKARKYFFDGYLLANSNRNRNTERGERALALFRQSLEWQPEQPQVYWQMSQVFGYNLFQLDSLEYYARHALEIYPNWLKPCTSAAFLLSDKFKQQDRARPFLEQASRIDSNSAEVWLHWASFNLTEKNYVKAEAQLKKSISLDSSIVETWNSLGYLCRQTRRNDEAELHYKKALALDSTYVLPWYNLGGIYNAARRYDEAELYYKKAIVLDSTYARAWNNLGFQYNSTRRYSEAETVIKKAITLDSTYSDPWINLGFLFIQIRHFDEAESALKKAVAIDSTNTRAWNNLGHVYSALRRYTEAESVFKKAVELDSLDVNFRLGLGGLYSNTGRFAEAEPVLKKAVALDPTNTVALNNLGSVYIKTFRYIEAEPFLQKAVGLDSTYAAAFNNLGFTYFNIRRYTEAEAILKKAIVLDSTSANARKHLGLVYFKTNRPEAARQSFLKAIALNPNYAAAMLGMAYLLASERKTDEAFTYIEQAIGKGVTLEQLIKDEDLTLLREQKEMWKDLIKKYFPEKIK